MKNKFEVCDIVKIYTDRANYNDVNNTIGIVSKIIFNQPLGKIEYTVVLPKGEKAVGRFFETELTPTGKKSLREKLNKFDFYDIVKIVRNENPELVGKLAIIRGISQDEETGQWIYCVRFYDNDELLFGVCEPDVISTDQKADPEMFKPVGTVKVQVDPESGEGKIVDSDLDEFLE